MDVQYSSVNRCERYRPIMFVIGKLVRQCGGQGEGQPLRRNFV